MDTYLTALIERSVTASVAATINRTAERAGEQMADELMRDPAVRARMLELIRAAFEKSLVELTKPVQP